MRIQSVTAIRDEGPWLLEWLAWHRLIGVTDFMVFSNDCRDGSDLMLDALHRHGVLIHRPHQQIPGKSIQWQALRSAWQTPERKAADWMLISDVDEFPVIHTGAHRLGDLIAVLPGDAEAVALAWRLFGHAGTIRFEDQPVTRQFTRSAPAEMLHPVAATSFKSLFRPEAFRRPGVHRPERHKDSPPARWYDGSGRALPPHIAGNDGRLSLIGVGNYRQLAELHHYSLRALESFIVKADRGLPNRTGKALDLAYWVERNFNAEPNSAAQSLLPGLEAEIAALKALPGVGELHEASCAWHRSRIAQLLRQPGFYRLFATCLHVGQSAVLAPGIAAALLRMYQQLEEPQSGASSKG